VDIIIPARREVRNVPSDWKHPVTVDIHGRKTYIPLRKYREQHFDLSPGTARQMMPCVGREPPRYQLYETETLGTPVSPVFVTKESLIHWLLENDASYIGDCGGTLAEWKQVVS
jgi:hypothetical protein